ncbi:hypothetical protein ABZP36_009218 [Zizania latifolia]
MRHRKSMIRSHAGIGLGVTAFEVLDTVRFAALVKTEQFDESPMIAVVALDPGRYSFPVSADLDCSHGLWGLLTLIVGGRGLWRLLTLVVGDRSLWRRLTLVVGSLRNRRLLTLIIGSLRHQVVAATSAVVDKAPVVNSETELDAEPYAEMAVAEMAVGSADAQGCWLEGILSDQVVPVAIPAQLGSTACWAVKKPQMLMLAWV